ncbi:hypothetical protein [Mucilaginibacter sp.]|uniref:hypothetical protein n=1 Tax=Mucilaginibacter sp. TaxID=1882438 RepID=UPI0035BC5CA9
MPATAQLLPNIAFSQNLIPFIVESTDYRDAVPATTINRLAFSGPIAADTVIALSWDTGAATMTAKLNPNDSGLQFPTGDGSAAYVSALLDWYQGNSFIDRDFDVAVDLAGPKPALIFTGNRKSPDLDFTEFAAGSVTCSVTVPGVSDSLKANFRHHEEVVIRNMANDGYLSAFNGNVELDYPVTGKTTLDLGTDILHSFLRPDYPELVNPFSRCLKSIRAYYCKYAQYQGADPAIWRLRRTSVSVVNMGGLGKKAATIRNLVSELCPVPADPAQNRFLRQGSKNKIVRADQPEWLTFINISAQDIVADLEIKVYNADQTVYTFNAVTGLSIPVYAKFQFQTGFNQLAIAGRQAANKIPLYYTCRIKTAAGYVSAAYANILEYGYQQWPRYFIYFNSYGAFQTVRTTGKSFGKYDRKSDTARLDTDKATAALTGDFTECNITIQEKYTVNAGYSESGKRNVALIRDFFRSPAVYAFEDGKLIPIQITTQTVEEPLDGQYVYASSFEYAVKYEEDNYTEDQTKVVDDTIDQLLNIAGTPPTGVDPGDGGGSEGDYIIVLHDDTHLSRDGRYQVYTAPKRLTGKENYVVNSTQTANYFRPSEISFNKAAGSFKILWEDFEINDGDMLIIWLNKQNPDSL